MGLPLFVSNSPPVVAPEPQQDDQTAGLAANENGRPAVVIDLQNALFDQHYSLRCAVRGLQQHFPALAAHNHLDLFHSLDKSTKRSQQAWWRGELPPDGGVLAAASLFFFDAGLPPPSAAEAEAFYEIYETAYVDYARPVLGSIELLVRLREWGIPVAAVAAGPRPPRLTDARSIDVYDLVDAIVTGPFSGAGLAADGTPCPAHPDVATIEKAIEKMGATPATTWLVLGDDCDCDGCGADLFEALAPRCARTFCYSPHLDRPHAEAVLSLIDVGRCLEHEKPESEPFDPNPPAGGWTEPGAVSRDGDSITLERLQMDLVTERRTHMVLTRDSARRLWRHMGGVLEDLEARLYPSALHRLESMLGIVGTAAADVNVADIDMLYLGPLARAVRPARPVEIPDPDPRSRVTERAHSVLVEFGTRTFQVPPRPGDGTLLKGCLKSLDEFCGRIEEGQPRAAMEDLRVVMRKIGRLAGGSAIARISLE